MAGSNSDFLYRHIFEVNPEDVGPFEKWVILQKGSPYNPFYYSPEYLLLHEGGSFSSVLSYASGRVTGQEEYGKPGLSFGKRTDLMYAFVMNKDQVFSVEGQAIFPLDNSEFWQCLAILNSSSFQIAVNTVCGQHKLHGYLNAVHFASQFIPDCSGDAKSIYLALQRMDMYNELSLIFALPLAVMPNSKEPLLFIIEERISERQADLERIRQRHMSINSRIAKTLGAPEEIIDEGVDACYISNMFGQDGSTYDEVHNLFSWLLGCLFGRWDIRLATGEKLLPIPPEPFTSLSICSQGMLQNNRGLPATPQDVPPDYPLRISWPGILVDEARHIEDVEKRVWDALSVIWEERSGTIEQEAGEILSVPSLRDYFRNSMGFFADHLKRYSKSRRFAPIYWPLSTPTNSYTLWLYYLRLSNQTLFTCVNDFVDPKLKQVSEETARLRLKKGRSASDEKDLERLTDFERELKDFRAELLRVAAFWEPNLNDGVQITAAPLWKLFQHKPWQKKLKETWEKLEAGEYDWAHLAYSIRPEQVREKCKTDKSLAIAHDLEQLYVEPKTPAKKKKGKKQAELEMDDLFDEN